MSQASSQPMVEPWVTPWSRFVFGKLHHEPFLPAASWRFAASGPLSGANGALPWIVLCRDRERFVSLCPDWEIEPPKLMLPLRYLLSGGVSLRSLVPGACASMDYFETGVELLIHQGVAFYPLDISRHRCIEIDFDEDWRTAQEMFGQDS